MLLCWCQSQIIEIVNVAVIVGLCILLNPKSNTLLIKFLYFLQGRYEYLHFELTVV